MKRSVFYQLGGAEDSDFERVSEEVVLAEELGIDTVWCFPAAGDEGDFREAAPAIWLSGLASRTQRIRLGWGVAAMLPPASAPLRVAEQGASLDLASEGRLELAFLPGDVLDEETDASWQEGFRMLVAMWDEPSFSWSSERFEVAPVDVLPKPCQRPHPPLWLAGWSLDHARCAGHAGLGFVDLSGAPDELLEIHHDAYAEGRAEAEPEQLVCVRAFAVAADLEPGASAVERLARWEALGFDEAILRVGPLDGRAGQAAERIRFLSGVETGVQ